MPLSSPKRNPVDSFVLISNARRDARSSVFAREFTELPLPRQHPKRIAHFSTQAAREIERARTSLQAIERNDARQAKDVRSR